MVLGDDHLYYVSLCEDQYSIRLAITPDTDCTVTSQGLKERWQLIEEFSAKLIKIVKAFMPASDLPQSYIPCSLCSSLHLKLIDIRANDKALHCINGRLPKDYYSDLRHCQGNTFPYLYSDLHFHVTLDTCEGNGVEVTGMV